MTNEAIADGHEGTHDLETIPLWEPRPAPRSTPAPVENDRLRAVGPQQALLLDGRGGSTVVPNPDPPVIIAGVPVSSDLGAALVSLFHGVKAHRIPFETFVARARELLAERGPR